MNRGTADEFNGLPVGLRCTRRRSQQYCTGGGPTLQADSFFSVGFIFYAVNDRSS